MLGGGADFREDAIMAKLESVKGVIQQVNEQFKNPVSSHGCLVSTSICRVRLVMCNFLMGV